MQFEKGTWAIDKEIRLYGDIGPELIVTIPETTNDFGKKLSGKTLRYDIIGADLEGINEHPQIQMGKLGYKLIHSEPVSIADCWIFEVEEVIEPRAPYLIQIDDGFFERRYND